MAQNSYFKAVTSVQSFKDSFMAENGRLFKELDEKPASGWDRRYLLGCRVIRRPSQPVLLPVLSQFVTPLTSIPPREIKEFLEGPGPGTLSMSEHALVNECGVLGFVWAALATFKGHPGRRTEGLVDKTASEDQVNENATGKKRIRRNTACEYFVDPRQIQIGSSSPVQADSQGSSSLGYMDVEMHASLVQPEDGTLRLLSCAIRHVLLFAPPQDSPALQEVVEFRDAKCRVAAWTPALNRRLVYVDDAGLCLRQLVDGVYHMTNSRVALVETKYQFLIENGQPVISDKCLAQMTCQALTARIADPREEADDSIILINGTQHFVCFLQFTISDEYLNDFESEEPASFMYVTATAVFDLSGMTGRRHFVSNISAFMNWAVES